MSEQTPVVGPRERRIYAETARGAHMTDQTDREQSACPNCGREVQSATRINGVWQCQYCEPTFASVTQERDDRTEERDLALAKAAEYRAEGQRLRKALVGYQNWAADVNDSDLVLRIEGLLSDAPLTAAYADLEAAKDRVVETTRLYTEGTGGRRHLFEAMVTALAELEALQEKEGASDADE